MDTATAAVVTTGVVGVAGIGATFFAPAWTQREIEQRRQARAFRRAKRLVASELNGLSASLRQSAESTSPPVAVELLTMGAWEAERAVLAESLSDEVWKELQVLYALVLRVILMVKASAESQVPMSASAGAKATMDVVADMDALQKRLLEAEPISE